MRAKMTVKQISEAIGVPRQTVLDAMNRIGIQMKQGVTTYLNEYEVGLVSKEVKKAHNFTTTREVESVTTLEKIEALAKAVVYGHELVTDLRAQNIRLIEEIGEMKPRAELADKFLSADNAMGSREIAMVFGMGQKTFLKMLRDNGVFSSDNLPYAQYRHHFKIIQKPISMGGKIMNRSVTLFCPSAVPFLRRKLGLFPEQSLIGA